MAGVLADAAGKTVEELAMLLATEKSGVARAALLENLIEQLNADNWKAVFEVVWHARQEGMISDREKELVLQCIGHIAGPAAMAQFKPADPVKDWDTHDGRHAMRGWAQADAATSLTWLEAQPEGNFRTGMALGFVRGAAINDPKRALQAVTMLSPENLQWAMNWMLNADEAAQYVPFVQQWLTSSAPGGSNPETTQTKSEVFSQLLNTQFYAIRNDSEGIRVARWVEQFAGRDLINAPAVSRMAAQFAERMAAPKVIELIERMAAPVAPGQPDPISVVMRRWSRQDPKAAQQWLNEHQDSPSYDAAVVAFVQNTPNAEPVVQRAWLDTVRD